MVLRRLLVMALGALGLGALSAGPAYAQNGNDDDIPVPDLFGDQYVCASRASVVNPGTPSVRGRQGTQPSDVDTLLGVGPTLGTRQPIAVDTTGALTSTEGMVASFSIDATSLNCGTGVVFGMTDGPEYEVVTGYNNAFAAYNTLVAAESAEETARLAWVAAGSPATGVTYDNYQAAQQTTTSARTAFSEAGAGQINQAGKLEWDAVRAIRTRAAEWNTALTALTTAQGAVDAFSYTNYRGVTGVSGITTALDAAGIQAIANGTNPYRSANFNATTGGLSLVAAAATETFAVIRTAFEAVQAEHNGAQRGARRRGSR